MKKSLGLLISRIAPSAEAMEPRHLYSGDGIGFATTPQAAQISLLSTQLVAQAEHSQQKTQELVVIDARVDQLELLTEDLAQQRASGRNIDVLVVDNDSDAFAGVLAYLQGAGGQLSAIHFVGHGQAGHMQLGVNGINSDSVSAAAQTLMQWSSYLTETADIRLYGCDFASEPQAQTVLASLSSLTGADIAASIDTTGHTDLGGNWVLEAESGNQESTALFTEKLTSNWQQKLADPIGALRPLMVAPPAVESGSNPVIGDTSSARAIAQNSDGQIIVVWSQNDPDNPSKTAIFGQFFSSNGSVNSAPVKLSQNLNASEDQVTVAALADGTFLVAWRANADTSNSSIEAQVVSSTGSLIGNAVTMNDPAAIDASRPTIAAGSDGTWMLAFQERTGFIGALNESGAQMGPWRLTAALGHQESQLTQRDSVDIVFSAHSIFDAQLVWNSAQKYTVAAQVHSNTVNFGRDFGLRFIELTTDAANQNIFVGSINQLNNFSNLSQDTVSIARLDNGGWVAVFEDDSTSVSKIRIRYFSPTGVPLANESYVDFELANIQTKPKVSIDPITNKVIVTWSARPIFGTNYEILGREFDQNGIATSDTFQIGESTSAITNGAVLFNDNTIYSLGTRNTPTNTLFAQLNHLSPGELIAVPTATTVVEGQTAQAAFSLSFAPTSTVLVRNSIDQTVATFTPTDWNIPQIISIPVAVVEGNQGTRSEGYTFSVTSNDPAFNSLTQTVNFTVMEPWAQFELIVDTAADNMDKVMAPTSVADLLLNRGTDGKISLREAILAINNTTTPNGELIRIRFNLGAQQEINLITALPSISKPIDIDGANFSGAIGLQINGVQASTTALLKLNVGAEGSKIEHIGLGNHGTGNLAHAILIYASRVTVDHVIIGSNQFTQASSPIAGVGIEIVEANGTIIRNSSIGNALTGILIDRSTATQIINNSIGINLNTEANNSNDGIDINDSTNSLVSGNEIGFNGTGGIRIRGLSTNNYIRANAIGTNHAHDLVASNGLAGISIDAGANNNWIGGTSQNDGNFIANSQYEGLVILSEPSRPVAYNNRIIGNQFYSNGNRAISLTSAQELWTNKPNDVGDSDQGPNEYLNSIELVAASSTATSMTIVSDYSGLASNQFRVDYYESPNEVSGGNGNNVGRWLGSAVFTTNTTGYARVTSQINSTVDDNTKITAIVTRMNALDQTFLSSSADSNRITVVRNAQPIWAGATNRSINENTSQGVLISVTDPTTQLSLEPTLLATFQGELFKLVQTPQGYFIEPRNALNFENPLGNNGTNQYIVEVQSQIITGESSIQRLSISVLDINEGAQLSLNSFGGFFEDQPIRFTGPQRVQVSISDPDAIQTLQRATLTIDQGAFVRPSDNPNITARSFSNQLLQLEANPSDLAQYLTTLQLVTAPNWSGSINLNVTIHDQTQREISDSATLSINVAAVNDAPELLMRSEQVVVGQSLVISPQTIQAMDVDSEPRFVYTLVNTPSSGALTLNDIRLEIGASFTQAQLDNGQIKYVATSIGSGSDTLILTVTDPNGATSNQATLKIALSGPVIIPEPTAVMEIAAMTQPPAQLVATQFALRPVSSLESQLAVAQSLNMSVDSSVSQPSVTTQSVAPSSSTADLLLIQATANNRLSPNANPSSGDGSPAPYLNGPIVGNNASRSGTRYTSEPSSALHSTDSQSNGTNVGVTSGLDSKESISKGTLSDSLAQAGTPFGSNLYLQSNKNSFSQLRATPSLSLTWERATVNQPSFTREIARVQQDLQAPIRIERTVVNSTVAVSTGVSIGYVIWMLRGGVLLSSLMASLPAWRTLDPLPVLSSLSGDDQQSDDDSLQSLLERAKKTLNKPDKNHVESIT